MTEDTSVFRVITVTCYGFFHGSSRAVPGVSGGTIALLLGIYERLLQNIHHCTDLVIRYYELIGRLRKDLSYL